MSPRGTATTWVWRLLWVSWIGFAVQQMANVARFGAAWPMWILWVLPVVLFMPAVARDNLRGVIWLCFVTLFYFVVSVEWWFAQPDSLVPMVGLVLIVLLFSSAVAYIRLRGPELRAASKVTETSASADADDTQGGGSDG